MSDKNLQQYWRDNIRYVLILLSIWFLVSYVFGIFMVDTLDTISLGGAPLGFWFAQQGAIFGFVAIIFIYIRWMNKLDKEFDVEED